MTITGTNLTGATAVKFGSTNAASFTVNSATSITATSPAGTGTVDVTVTTAGGTSATSSADQFAYTSTPTVTSISPTTGPATGGTSVTITGTNLTGATAVKFGSTNAASFTVNSATSITATSPAGTGTVSVTVTTPSGTATAGNFTYGVPVDSQNLRSLQNAATQAVATFSGQAITGAVDSAIGDAFGGGGTAPITPSANGISINFAAEPQREPRVDEAFNALAYAANVNKAPSRAPLFEREWSAWADVRGTGFDRDTAGAGMNGHQLNLTGGIGRKLTPDLLVGVFTGYERFVFTMDSIAGRMTGDGRTVGTYAGWRFASHWRVHGILGWSKIAYNATAGTATGAFAGSRWLASGGLTGRYNYAAFVLEPSARIYALWESENAFTDSLGTAQAARNFSAGRIATGGKVLYPWRLSSNVRISPYVGLYGDWRFSSDNALPVGQPLVGIQNGWSGRVTTGITTMMSSGLAVSLGAELGGLGAGYEVWSANARVNWPF